MDRRTHDILPLGFAAVYALLAVTIVLDGTLIGISALRAVLGIFALGVLPGVALCAFLGLSAGTLGRMLLYAIPLSQVLAVFSAVVLNQLGWLGIESPLTPLTVTIAVGIVTTALGYRHQNHTPERSLVPEIDRPSIHELAGVGLLTGTLVAAGVLTRAETSWPLLLVLCAIAGTPLLLLRTENDRLIGYGIWAIAGAVLLQMTLVSNHIWGFDIHYELYSAREIFLNGHWDATRESPSTSLVMVTLLGANYAAVTGIELVWVYKLVVPLLVALLPVGVWTITRWVSNDRSLATLAPFALVFYYGFFKDMPDKQLLAGLYGTLLLVVLLDTALDRRQRIALGLCLALGLVGSHYGVSLLFAAFLGGTMIARVLLERRPGETSMTIDTRLSRPWIVGTLLVLWIGWYATTADAVNLRRIVATGLVLIESLPFPTSGRSGAGYATTSFGSPVWMLYKLLYFGLVGSIGLGLLRSVVDSWFDRTTVTTEYTLLSCGVFAFLAASVVVTFGMGFDRTLQIGLFVLGPFAVIGARTGMELLDELYTRLAVTTPDWMPPVGPDQLFAVFLAVLFVFSSGVAFTATGAELPPYNLNVDEDAGWPVYTDKEVTASRWLEAHTDPDDTVAVYNEWRHIKSRDGLLISEVIHTSTIEPIWLQRESLDTDAYVYVSHKPMRKLSSDSEYIRPHNTTFYREYLSSVPIVYQNERATIYHVRP